MQLLKERWPNPIAFFVLDEPREADEVIIAAAPGDGLPDAAG